MDEDSPVFGPVAYKLKLSEAIRRQGGFKFPVGAGCW
jgi:hypothetical protein